jgi:segregation and condensation protein B
MEISNLIPHLEALIFASDRPLTSLDLTELINNACGFMEDKVTLEQVQTAIDGIVEKYQSEFYPFEMKESGGGWQFLTKKEYHKTVAQLNGEKFLKRLSTAALETLAIIAYKQPITKADIESIRGVNSDYSIQKLLEKELIVITGRNEEMPGKPLVYATSKTFMDYFGINSPQELPKLKEIYDEAMIQPTIIHERNNPDKENEETENDNPEMEVSENSILLVSENGQLVEDNIDDESETATRNNPHDTDDLDSSTADNDSTDKNE